MKRKTKQQLKLKTRNSIFKNLGQTDLISFVDGIILTKLCNTKTENAENTENIFISCDVQSFLEAIIGYLWMRRNHLWINVSGISNFAVVVVGVRYQTFL